MDALSVDRPEFAPDGWSDSIANGWGDSAPDDLNGSALDGQPHALENGRFDAQWGTIPSVADESVRTGQQLSDAVR